MKSIVDIRNSILSRRGVLGARSAELGARSTGAPSPLPSPPKLGLPLGERETPGLAEQVACARRELALRQNVYPKRVAAGRMTGATAERETAAMAAIVETLERCLMLEEISEELKAGK